MEHRTDMKIQRPSLERGHANHGWLDSRFTFSFADYYDPDHMGFSTLRVINDDHVAPSGGFPTHPHKDMEIVTYVLSGKVAHKDSMGTSTVITPGEVQRMSAGSGILHSEMNPSSTEALHLLQIWILPSARGIAPGYEQKRFDDKQGRLRLVASPDGKDGSVTIHTDAKIYATVLDDGDKASLDLNGKKAWLHVARGRMKVNGLELREGDGLGFVDEPSVILEGQGGEALLFELP
jgi:redox-sensitive bicupin YhaK (pirin superfamily)